MSTQPTTNESAVPWSVDNATGQPLDTAAEDSTAPISGASEGLSVPAATGGSSLGADGVAAATATENQDELDTRTTVYTSEAPQVLESADHRLFSESIPVTHSRIPDYNEQGRAAPPIVGTDLSSLLATGAPVATGASYGSGGAYSTTGYSDQRPGYYARDYATSYSNNTPQGVQATTEDDVFVRETEPEAASSRLDNPDVPPKDADQLNADAVADGEFAAGAERDDPATVVADDALPASGNGATTGAGTGDATAADEDGAPAAGKDSAAAAEKPKKGVLSSATGAVGGAAAAAGGTAGGVAGGVAGGAKNAAGGAKNAAGGAKDAAGNAYKDPLAAGKKGMNSATEKPKKLGLWKKFKRALKIGKQE
ncbi:hypothetical protein MSPP1_002977 [Malassezia sp. CBS 17886]|nr:hypothetical protein MSPP1_002977 [Malassezia sp. CBS 17886]